MFLNQHARRLPACREPDNKNFFNARLNGYHLKLHPWPETWLKSRLNKVGMPYLENELASSDLPPRASFNRLYCRYARTYLHRVKPTQRERFVYMHFESAPFLQLSNSRAMYADLTERPRKALETGAREKQETIVNERTV